MLYPMVACWENSYDCRQIRDHRWFMISGIKVSPRPSEQAPNMKVSKSSSSGMHIVHRTCTPSPPSPIPNPTSLAPKSPKKKNQRLTGQKFFKAQRNISIPIRIILLEHIRHPLQTYTALNKHVKAHALVPAFVVDAVHHAHEVRREVVPERHQRLAEFVVRDRPASVLVEAAEESAPGGEETPEATRGGSVGDFCWGLGRRREGKQGMQGCGTEENIEV